MKSRSVLLLLSFALLQNVRGHADIRAEGDPTGTGITLLPPPPTTSPPTPPVSPPVSPPPSDTSTSTTTSSTTKSSTTTSETSTSETSTSSTPPPTSPTASIETETQVSIFTPSASGPPTPSQSQAQENDGGGSSGFGTGSIIGLSVAGGVALLGLIGFFVWKFTRKRNGDFDDNEAIKWPELNAHNAGGVDSHPLPVHNTGRAGFDTGSDGELSRVPSATTYSTGEYNPQHHDPYAVPPLPHLNPNQPYLDDPTGASGYYDPYRGPVPNTFHEGAPEGNWGPGGEAIPMTQMGGRMSPGPGMAYDGGRSTTPMTQQGRASPGPGAAYAADPYAGGAGRASPGPQNAYGGVDPYGGGAGRASPGPQNAYGAGRASPGPQGAYGRTSPGPQAAYDYGQRL